MYFSGRILRVAEYQMNHIIVLIQHIWSPAILSLAIPYEYFAGDEETLWRWLVGRVMRKVTWLCQHDSTDYLSGKLPRDFAYLVHLMFIAY